MSSSMDVDLAKSGLVASDINARVLETPERATTVVPHNIDGYVIPYYDIYGRALAYYRVRLFDFEPKYKQPKETSSYVYFPKGFLELARAKDFLVITEGEKKAAIACKLGIPCVALGGVDSWRNRTVVLPSDSELTSLKNEKVSAKLPSGGQIDEDMNSSLAIGMQELIDFAIKHDKQVLLVFDSDGAHGVKASVQRAAAQFGFELRFKGIAFYNVRQLVLPTLPGTPDSKVGLDDYLVNGGRDHFFKLVQDTIKKKSAFPLHPTIRDFVSRRLQKFNLTRKEIQAVAMGILSDLDSKGNRLRGELEAQTYYFDSKSSQLMKAQFGRKDFYDTPFGQFLYRNYGIGASDNRLFEWLAAQFTGEDPIERVSPHRVIARISPKDDCVIYQLSDSKYAKVSSLGLHIYNNGENGVLFESGHVEALDTDKLREEFERQLINSERKNPNYWANILSSVRLKDQQQQRIVTSLLYYLSPWLYKWRGTQLPIEMLIGESGSGKSTLCELRLSILTGQARLRNAPQDLKDWHASIANTGGLHVTDNVQLVDRNLRQRLSDEICRIITEPNPHIEMRKYYTEADLVRLPVRSVFAITAIQQPFQNADIIQRSIITELDKFPKGASTDSPIVITYDSEWLNTQLAKYNGREGWVAHHLMILHKFFKLVKEKWDDKYQAKHRLINLEQSMMLMAELFQIDANWIPTYLTTTVDKALSDSDWTFEGLKEFALNHSQYYREVTTQTIADWATGRDEYQKCEILINTRRLGRYLQTHKTMIASMIGLIESGTRANRQTYKVVKPQEPK